MKNKICIDCKKEFSKDFFYKGYDSKDGYHLRCKKCWKIKYPKEYWKALPSQYRTRHEMKPEALERLRIIDKKYQRIKRAKNPERKIEETRRYAKENPEKVKAVRKVYNAIKRGDLIRKKCRDCERKDTHGHHPDYSKPLNVIWLCPIHHKLEHIKMRSIVQLSKT